MIRSGIFCTNGRKDYTREHIYLFMIKKAVIFAGGKGTRMKELAKERPKHLIEVNGRPFLYYLLGNLKGAGFEEIVMVTGHLHPLLERFIDRHRRKFPFFRTVNQRDIFGEKKYGTLVPLLSVKDIVRDEQFVVVMGDNLYATGDLKAFRSLEDEMSYVGGYHVEDPTKYGVLVAGKEGTLVRIDERSPHPSSRRINAGIYKFTPEIYDVAGQVELSPRGEYEITDALSLLAVRGKVKIVDLKDYWFDFGRPEDVAVVEKFLQDNQRADE